MPPTREEVSRMVANSKIRKTPDMRSLKNRLLEALTDEWQRMSEINQAHFPGVAPAHLGHALLTLVSENLADRKEVHHKVYYRKGTGRNYMPEKKVKGVIATHSSKNGSGSKGGSTKLEPLQVIGDPVSLTPSLETVSSGGGGKVSAPAVIPAGHDYLVFSNIAKIRVLGLEKVAVFWCVPGGENYNLAVDTYEGQAALDIQEAFEQRLKGWVSTAYIAEVRTKLKNTELERNEVTNELKRVKEQLRKMKATLKGLTANLNLDNED